MKQLNMRVLNNRYKNLIPEDKEAFAKNLTGIKTRLNFEAIDTLKPLLIYTRGYLNELVYLLNVNYSLEKSKVLNHVIVTGQTLTRQNFADGDKDKELHDDTYYEDILYITLSQSDGLSEYMENILQDLVDFRYRNSKQTVIIYDIMQGMKPQGQTKRIEDFLKARQYIIQDITGFTTGHSATTTTTTNNDTVQGKGIARGKGRPII